MHFAITPAGRSPQRNADPRVVLDTEGICDKDMIAYVDAGFTAKPMLSEGNMNELGTYE